MNRRVFLLGAGASYECGSPLISTFREAIQEHVPRSRTQSLRALWQQHPDATIEDLLTGIDERVLEGLDWDGIGVPGLRSARRELVSAISQTLVGIQYAYLSEHYGYARFRDPYYHWARRTRALDRVRREVNGDIQELERRMWSIEAGISEGFALAENPWHQVVESWIRTLFQGVSDETRSALVSAALAAGRSRFAGWITALWPFFEPADVGVLGITRPRWGRESALTVLMTIRALLGETTGPGGPDFVRAVDRQIQDVRQQVPTEHEILGWWGEVLISDVFPTLATRPGWLERQVTGLLSTPASTGVNPYALLAAVVRPSDVVVTLNYDLFAEYGVSVETGYYPDYEIPDLLWVCPWDSHGPFLSPA